MHSLKVKIYNHDDSYEVKGQEYVLNRFLFSISKIKSFLQNLKVSKILNTYKKNKESQIRNPKEP